jgi:hypothetical protein
MSSSSQVPASTSSASTASNNFLPLCQFLNGLTKYNPTYPASLSRFYLERAGLNVKDERIVKLVSLAADKIIAEIITEAKTIPSLKDVGAKNTRKRYERPPDSLDVEDLEASLNSYRIFLRKKSRTLDEKDRASRESAVSKLSTNPS